MEIEVCSRLVWSFWYKSGLGHLLEMLETLEIWKISPSLRMETLNMILMETKVEQVEKMEKELGSTMIPHLVFSLF